MTGRMYECFSKELNAVFFLCRLLMFPPWAHPPPSCHSSFYSLKQPTVSPYKLLLNNVRVWQRQKLTSLLRLDSWGVKSRKVTLRDRQTCPKRHRCSSLCWRPAGSPPESGGCGKNASGPRPPFSSDHIRGLLSFVISKADRNFLWSDATVDMKESRVDGAGPTPPGLCVRWLHDGGDRKSVTDPLCQKPLFTRL